MKMKLIFLIAYFIYSFTTNKSASYNRQEFVLEPNKKDNQSPMFFSRRVLEDKIDITFY